MNGSFGQLIDEMAKLRMVQTHELMNIGKTERSPGTTSGRRSRRRFRAAKYTSECDKEVVEETTEQNAISTTQAGGDTNVQFIRRSR